jgi:hypothetical protein
MIRHQGFNYLRRNSALDLFDSPFLPHSPPRIRITFPSAAPSSALFAAFLYASLYWGGAGLGSVSEAGPPHLLRRKRVGFVK